MYQRIKTISNEGRFNENVEINATPGKSMFRARGHARRSGYEPLWTRLSAESRVLLSAGEKLFLTSIFSERDAIRLSAKRH